jgi:hypothetical protein
MRWLLAMPLTAALATSAAAQSGILRAGGAEFLGVKTYWTEKRDGCRPVISFQVKNTSAEEIGPIEFRLEVVDTDSHSVFARGEASLASSDLPPGRSREIAIGGDRDITPLDCLGDMHQIAFSGIHFTVRLNATIGKDAEHGKIAWDTPMSEERVPAQN